MSDTVANLVKLNKRYRQMLDVLRGIERGASRADWQAAIGEAKILTGKDGKFSRLTPLAMYRRDRYGG